MGLFLVLFAVLFWFCFWSVSGFELSHSLLFTQKLWRFSGLSERALDLLLGLCLGVPSISRLFNLDCRYPRDQLQPARKKPGSKARGGSTIQAHTCASSCGSPGQEGKEDEE